MSDADLFPGRLKSKIIIKCIKCKITFSYLRVLKSEIGFKVLKKKGVGATQWFYHLLVKVVKHWFPVA